MSQSKIEFQPLKKKNAETQTEERESSASRICGKCQRDLPELSSESPLERSQRQMDEGEIKDLRDMVKRRSYDIDKVIGKIQSIESTVSMFLNDLNES